jgi:hypothetical protein
MDASTNNTNDCPRPTSRFAEPVRSALTKSDWIQLYTSRILRAWFHQDAPLGLALSYANWIRRDLDRSYTHPLRRAFIEETYRLT